DAARFIDPRDGDVELLHVERRMRAREAAREPRDACRDTGVPHVARPVVEAALRHHVFLLAQVAVEHGSDGCCRTLYHARRPYHPLADHADECAALLGGTAADLGDRAAYRSGLEPELLADLHDLGFRHAFLGAGGAAR